MQPSASILPLHLRCEYHRCPLGVETPRPRLDWQLVAAPGEASRGLRQAAWQVLVASSAALLAADEGDLWDSGRVEGGASIQIAYAGRTLVSSQECHWKVRVWDGEGRASAWSEPARWTMGLLAPTDWQAQWIRPEPRPALPLSYEGAYPFWHAADLARARRRAAAAVVDPEVTQTRYFRGTFELESGRPLLRARLLVAADGHTKFYLDGIKVAQSQTQKQSWREPQLVNLLAHLEPGAHLFAASVEFEGKVRPSLMGRLLIEFADGGSQVVILGPGWRSTDEVAASDCQPAWNEPPFEEIGWTPVAVLPVAETPWRECDLGRFAPRDVDCLRRTFAVEGTAHGGLRRALLRVSALGICELELNGQRVGDAWFSPGWTDYRVRVPYQSFEVTELLAEGPNAIGAQLAAGWYAGHVGWTPPGQWGTHPALLAQLELEFADGTRQVLATDEQWQAHAGPVLDADFQMGEHYDARAELPGWSTASFTAPPQAPARPVHIDATGVPPLVQAHAGDPVRVTERLRPRSISEAQPGVWIFDLGQNMVGVPRLRIRGARAGQRITLRHGEMLNPDGSLYTTNLRRARALDIYLCAGRAEEFYTPRFTFHGFRYVEVRGLTAPPMFEDIEGLVLGSDTPRTLEFASSSPLLNQLASNIAWGQRGNYLEVPTDCPQRDERLGWTGDAQVFIRTAGYLVDMGPFFTKWLVDLEDARNDEGAYSDTAPIILPLSFGSAAWGDAGIICPYHLWRAYGDLRAVERHWTAMARYIAWQRETSAGLIRPDYGYGDWLCIGADTPKPLIGTAYFAYNCALMAEMARALGREEEARGYERLRGEIVAAFRQQFVAEDGRLVGNTQTAYVLALHMDLLTATQRAQAIQHLAEDIAARGGLLSVGFVGISYLCPVLAANGRLDLAYQLLLEERYPSWGYEVRNGATTIWERWNSYNTETGFGDVRMNSFNHYAFGSIGEWMYDTVCGVAQAEPGYGTIRLRPRPGNGLSHARLRYQSIRGPIGSAWRLEKDRLRYEFEVPPNTTALLSLATAEPEGVTEGGQALAAAAGVEILSCGEGELELRLGSGRYTFSAAPAAELIPTA